MASIGTYCNGCIFYEEKNKVCKHNLIEIFKSRGAKIDEAENGSLAIDRICQYKRLNDWHPEKTIEERMNLCNDDVYISGTIILIAEDKHNLKKTLDRLISNPKISRFKFLIIYKDIKYKDMMEVCGNRISSNCKYIMSNTDDLNFQIYKSLKFAKNGYLFIFDCNKDFDDLAIDKVNSLVNKKLFRLLHIPGSDGIHQSVSMIHLYKWLKADLQFNFAEKLKDISQQENSDSQVLNWKEVNEQYSS